MRPASTSSTIVPSDRTDAGLWLLIERKSASERGLLSVAHRPRPSAHRAHASTAGVTEFLRPAVAGHLLESEVSTLEDLVEDPDRPLVVVLGGAKVTDKVKLIERFMEIADAILIGGAMCFAFFKAQGKPTGDSLVYQEGVDVAREVLERADTGSLEGILQYTEDPIVSSDIHQNP